jgi:hypothetical protein
MKQVTFEVNGKGYILPNKISIENYVKFYKVKDILADDYFNAKFLNIFTGCPVEDLLETDWDSVRFLSNQLMELMPTPKTPFVETFELNGVEYGFITDWKKMSFAEYADADTLASKKPEDMLNYLHILAAIFYRPIVKKKLGGKYVIEKYNSETMEERAELFNKELDVSIVIGAQFFFTLFAKTLQDPIQQFSTLTMIEKIKMIWQMMKMKDKINSEKPMDGMQSLINSQMTILRNTIQSSKNQSQKSSTSWPSWLRKTKTL